MSEWMLAVLLRPFMLFVLAVFVLYPARMAVQKHMRDGKLKRLLLKRVN